MARPTLPSVEETVDRLRELLNRARKLKTTDIEPALPISEFSAQQGLPSRVEVKSSQYPIIEVAARQLFHEYVVRNSSRKGQITS
jgi:hypothetical protein